MNSKKWQIFISNIQIGFQNLNLNLIFLLFSIGALCGSSEAAAASIAVGVGPFDIASGKFSGNGSDDIAVTSSNSLSLTQLTIFLNDGLGNFNKTQQFTIAPKGTWAKLDVGSFSAGGGPDIAVLTNPGSLAAALNLFIYENNLSGTFTPQGSFSVGRGATCLAAAALAGGSKGDLIIGYFEQQQLQVLLGNGMGGFIPALTIPLISNPTSVATGRIFGFEDDIVVTYGNTNQIQVFRNNGMGLTFSPAGTYTVGTFPTDVIVQDLNNDGFSDIAVTNGKSNNVSVLINKGDGTFFNAVNYAVADAPTNLTAADFNNDSKFGLGVANQAGSTVSILTNNGNGTFQPSTTHTTGSGPVSITRVSRASSIHRLATADLTGGTVSVISR